MITARQKRITVLIDELTCLLREELSENQVDLSRVILGSKPDKMLAQKTVAAETFNESCKELDKDLTAIVISLFLKDLSLNQQKVSQYLSYIHYELQDNYCRQIMIESLNQCRGQESFMDMINMLKRKAEGQDENFD